MTMKQKAARLLSISRKKAVSVLAVVGAVAGTSAHAADPLTALEGMGTLSASNVGYGPIMFGLAVAAVSIGIGVKWIKRTRGAA